MKNPDRYLEWLRKLPTDDVAYSDAVCIECGSRGLSFQYLGVSGNEFGWKLVWCGECNSGIRISRTKIPNDAVVLVRENEQKEFLDSHSNIRLIS